MERLKKQAICEENIQSEKKEKNKYDGNFESSIRSMEWKCPLPTPNSRLQIGISKSSLDKMGKFLWRFERVFLAVEREIFKMGFCCRYIPRGREGRVIGRRRD